MEAKKQKIEEIEIKMNRPVEGKHRLSPVETKLEQKKLKKRWKNDQKKVQKSEKM
jgi:hypothetical protein